MSGTNIELSHNYDDIITEDDYILSNKYRSIYILCAVEKNNKKIYRRISPWHDIALYAKNSNKFNGIIPMVVEIPKNTREKIEINKNIDHNPLTYEIKNGNIRKVLYGDGYPVHYGAIPQTWENPYHIDHRTGFCGDGDPMDIFDISQIPTKPGCLIKVKVLGCIAMIDRGETDWKVISINILDPNSTKYNDIGDVEQGIIDGIIDFLSNYKGKNATSFAEQIMWDKNQTYEIIKEQYYNWKKYMSSNI